MSVTVNMGSDLLADASRLVHRVVGSEGYGLAYGSHARDAASPWSDLDLLVVGRADLDQDASALLVTEVKRLHHRHGLKLDDEVSYEVKLYASAAEVTAAIAFEGFTVGPSGDLRIPRLVASPAFLNSDQFKLRLVPVAALSVPGAVLLRLEVPRNAPAGGAYLGVCLELAGLPLWTDWYVWPASTAAVPADAVVVVERTGVPLPHSAERFMPLLDRHRTAATGKADRADPRFRLLAVMLAAKYLARRDADRLAHMLRLLALEPIEAEQTGVLLRSVLQSMAGVELRPAVTAATALLELAAASGVPQPDEESA